MDENTFLCTACPPGFFGVVEGFFSACAPCTPGTFNSNLWVFFFIFILLFISFSFVMHFFSLFHLFVSFTFLFYVLNLFLSIFSGATSCQPCPFSTFADGQGATRCLPCGAGLTTDASGGASICTPPSNQQR